MCLFLYSRASDEISEIGVVSLPAGKFSTPRLSTDKQVKTFVILLGEGQWPLMFPFNEKTCAYAPQKSQFSFSSVD